MTVNNPLVSVVIPSYNQGAYIAKAINSILTQDLGDFELLISDDASPDNSVEVISSFSNPRIKLFVQKKNLGPVGNLDFLIKQSRGKYIALLNSDDFWYPNKLRQQVELMTSQDVFAACFTWADLIDENGKAIKGIEAMWADVFKQQNRNQAEWLNHFYFKGNAICHPSMLIKRSVYDEIGSYNPALRQLPDFEMWIRLVRKYPIYVIPVSLVGHLRTSNNTSTHNAENIGRNLTELTHIFGNFFAEMSDELFITGFRQHFLLPDLPFTSEMLLCEQFFLLKDKSFAPVSFESIALSFFYQHGHNKKFLEMLEKSYGFSIFDYYKQIGISGIGYHWIASMNMKTHSFKDMKMKLRFHCRDLLLYKKIKILARMLGLIKTGIQ